MLFMVSAEAEMTVWRNSNVSSLRTGSGSASTGPTPIGAGGRGASEYSETPARPTESVLETIHLQSLLVSFLKIGSIGFGGGMAVIALMEQELVQKRRVISTDDFISGVGLGQMLGAFAVNTAVFIGYRLFGLSGALLSAGAFLLPSAALVILLSDLYFRYHTIPSLQATVAGLSPVAIALILSAAWSIGRKALHSWPKFLVASAALAAGVLQVNPVWVLLSAGAIGFLLPSATPSPDHLASPSGNGESKGLRYLSIAVPVGAPLSTVTAVFFKIGLIFFGGGFVLVPILRSRLVAELKWLRPQEFLDGLAISNLTPGPIAVLATFAGYHMGGVGGALAATGALFAPGIILMIALSHGYNRLRNDTKAQRFLSGVNPAVAGLIVSAAFLLGRGTVVSWHGYLLLVVSLALLVRLRWHPAVVLAIGAGAGYIGFLP